MATGLTFKSITLMVMMITIPALLVGCGRAGPPLKPSEAAIERAKKAEETPPDAPIPNKSNPDKRFILDGLLD